MASASNNPMHDPLSGLAAELKLEIISHLAVPDIRKTLLKVSQHFAEVVAVQEKEILRRLSAKNIPKALCLPQPWICDSYDAIEAHNLIPKILRGVMLREQGITAAKALYRQWSPALEHKTQVLTREYFRLPTYDDEKNAMALRRVGPGNDTCRMYMRLWHRRTGEILVVPAIIVWMLGALTADHEGPNHPLDFGNPASHHSTGLCPLEPRPEVIAALDNDRLKLLWGSYMELKSQDEFDALVNTCTSMLVDEQRPSGWLKRCIDKQFRSLWIDSHNKTFTAPSVMAEAPYQAIPF